LFWYTVMAWTARQYLVSDVVFGLGKAIQSVRGWPRQLTDQDQARMAETIVAHLERSNYTITRPPAQIKPSPKWAGR
jgi:hypothetical protein